MGICSECEGRLEYSSNKIVCMGCGYEINISKVMATPCPETCPNCGGILEYLSAQNKIICDTCDYEIEEAI